MTKVRNSEWTWKQKSTCLDFINRKKEDECRWISEWHQCAKYLCVDEQQYPVYRLHHRCSPAQATPEHLTSGVHQNRPFSKNRPKKKKQLNEVRVACEKWWVTYLTWKWKCRELIRFPLQKKSLIENVVCIRECNRIIILKKFWEGRCNFF